MSWRVRAANKYILPRTCTMGELVVPEGQEKDRRQVKFHRHVKAADLGEDNSELKLLILEVEG